MAAAVARASSLCSKHCHVWANLVFFPFLLSTVFYEYVVGFLFYFLNFFILLGYCCVLATVLSMEWADLKSCLYLKSTLRLLVCFFSTFFDVAWFYFYCCGAMVLWCYEIDPTWLLRF